MNLIFDVDDTLYDLMKPFNDTYYSLFGDKYDIPVEQLYKKNRQYSDEVFELVQSGRMTVKEMHIYRISKAFESFGIIINEEEALNFQSQYLLNQDKIVVFDGIKHILDFSKSHNLNMGIITNGIKEHQMKKIKTLNLENWIKEENIFVSADFSLPKPHSEIFKFAEKKMNLDPKETYYIGDTFENDVVGAKNAGWNSIWVNRRNSSQPLETQYLPDYIAKNDQELLNLIKELI